MTERKSLLDQALDVCVYAPVGLAIAGAPAIPGYDPLSGTQDVNRLARHAPKKLETVRAYKVATRGRRTLLTRIAQMQANSSSWGRRRGGPTGPTSHDSPSSAGTRWPS